MGKLDLLIYALGMVEVRRRREKVLGLTLGLLVSLGSPARAVAQTPNDADTWSSGVPDESIPPEAPAAPVPASPVEEPPVEPPPAELPALPPAKLPAPHAQPPMLGEPRFPVTFDSDATSLSIRGPGFDKPLTCSATCTFALWEGTYWLEIEASGRRHTVPVTVTEPERVVIEKPNAAARGLGVAGIIVGGSMLSVAGFVGYAYLVSCGNGAPDAGSAQCNSTEESLPYWLVTAGVGAVVSVVGIGLFVSNRKPSVEVTPVLGNRARREPGTFVGLAPVGRSTLPGFSLQTSF
ncbi:MAG TPA: hypothetical protein VFZ53_00010 [Polyangiaceae bacterium]